MAISANGINSATAALTHLILALPILSGCSLIPISSKKALFFYKPVYNAVTDSANS